MKKLLLFFTMIAIPNAASAQIKIVATLPVFASIAQEIGGDRVETKSLARTNQDPHFLDAKPSFVVTLNQADLLVQGGLDLEIGWLPPLLVQARNPKINPNTPGNVDLSKGLRILEIPDTKVDPSQGDVHPGGNPHVWLDPENVKIMGANIAQHLIALDPEGQKIYETNLRSWNSTLSLKIIEWKRKVASLKLAGRHIITYHRSLSYLADWTGMVVVATLEPKPGIPPSSKHIDTLLSKISSLDVKAILIESFYPQKVPQYLSETSHVPLIEVPSDVGEEGTKNYVEMMDRLLGRLEKLKGDLP